MADGATGRAVAGKPDEGGAVVEFLAMSLLLLVPLIYLVVSVSLVQAGAYAAESAAQGAARAAVVAGVEVLESGGTEAQAGDAAAARARAVTEVGVGDFGFTADDAFLKLTCSGDPCLAPGSEMQAEVTVEVALPGVPGFLADAGLTVTVTAQASSPVDDLGGSS